MKNKNATRASGGKLALLGVGGGGAAVVSQLANGFADARILLLDSDSESLCRHARFNTLLMGAEITRGLGCGADTSLGEECVRANMAKLCEQLEGATALIIVAPMGGGFGSGAAIAISKRFQGERPVLVLGLLPLACEGSQRIHEAAMGTASLRHHCAALALVENGHSSWSDESTAAREVFHAANKHLADELRGLCRYWMDADSAKLNADDLRGVFSSPEMLHEAFVPAQSESGATGSMVKTKAKVQAASKSTQQNLPFKSISRGRFESSPPSIHKGVDLDVPTFWRWNVVLSD